MNNSLMSYGPRLWNELNIVKRKLVSISVIIFKLFVNLVIFFSTIIFYLKSYFNIF